MKKSKTSKKVIAVWLDHTVAHFIKVKNDKVIVQSIVSGFEPQMRYASKKTEKAKTAVSKKKALSQLDTYYKQITDHLAKYKQIYLFGPVSAKTELLNRVRQTKLTGKSFIVNSATDLGFSQMVAEAKAILGTA